MERNLTMMTDLYQLTMMYGHFVRGSKDEAVFDLFFREPTGNSTYAIVAGLEQAIDYIKNLHFSAEDVAYLEEYYLPHPTVGAIDKNPAQGVMLLDEKK